MLIYKVTIQLNKGAELPELNCLQRRSGKRIFLTKVAANNLTVCQVADWTEDAEATLAEWLKKRSLPGRVTRREEIPVFQLAQELEEGNEKGLCPEPPDVLARNNLLAVIRMPFCMGINEGEISQTISGAKALKTSASLYSHSLTEELRRINACAEIPFQGHPLVYAVKGASDRQAEEMAWLIFAATHAAGHLPSKRICNVNPSTGKYPESILRDLYKAQSGASVLVRVDNDMDAMEEHDVVSHNYKLLARIAREFRSSVLTVFAFREDRREAEDTLLTVAGGSGFLFIGQDRLPRQAAQKMLRALARERGIRASASLTHSLPKSEDGFSTEKLRSIFDMWYDRHLLTEVYPQYVTMLAESDDEKRPEGGKGKTLEQLSSLIGLTEVKRVVVQLSDYARVRKMRKDRGIPTGGIGFHMVFTGNPGTAKTTVARLTAQLLHESDILPSDKLVEVGRGDLVGKYVGWTAQRVKEKFKEAKGGVLFIDEAYSLLDDRENEFGDEAISTIVQEMENRRNDTVVIFAGYREPMKSFVERNPGLASRVSFFLDFPDYSEDELMDIFQSMLRENGQTVTPEAEDKARCQLREAMAKPQFGNGRYVRRMLERAQLAQASRLMAYRKSLTDDAFLLLTAEDFISEQAAEKPCRAIGFAG